MFLHYHYYYCYYYSHYIYPLPLKESSFPLYRSFPLLTRNLND